MMASDIEIANLSDLLRVVDKTNDVFQGQVWWRGQQCWNWSLQPSTFRAGRGSTFERSANIRFRQRAPIRHNETPKDDDFFGWLFLMQHHRLPTRLLDWTESPLIATFFASFDGDCPDSDLDDTNCQDAALFALSPYLLNKNQINEQGLLVPEDSRALAAVRPAFSRDVTDKGLVLAIRPPELFLRMMVQLSVFTIHGSGMLVEEINEKETLLVKYRIPYSAKKSIRNELIRLGIRESNIFPDLDHLGDEVSRIKFIDPPKQEISYLDSLHLTYDNGVRGVESST